MFRKGIWQKICNQSCETFFLPTYAGLWSCVFVENVENCTYFVIITYFIIQSFITYRELMSTRKSTQWGNTQTLHKVPLYQSKQRRLHLKTFISPEFLWNQRTNCPNLHTNSSLAYRFLVFFLIFKWTNPNTVS